MEWKMTFHANTSITYLRLWPGATHAHDPLPSRFCPPLGQKPAVGCVIAHDLRRLWISGGVENYASDTMDLICDLLQKTHMTMIACWIR